MSWIWEHFWVSLTEKPKKNFAKSERQHFSKSIYAIGMPCLHSYETQKRNMNHRKVCPKSLNFFTYVLLAMHVQLSVSWWINICRCFYLFHKTQKWQHFKYLLPTAFSYLCSVCDLNKYCSYLCLQGHSKTQQKQVFLAVAQGRSFVMIFKALCNDIIEENKIIPKSESI